MLNQLLCFVFAKFKIACFYDIRKVKNLRFPFLIPPLKGKAEEKMVSQWTGGIVTRNEEAANRFTFSQDGESTYWSVSWEAPNYNQHERYAAHVLR